VWAPLLDRDLLREGGPPLVLPRGVIGAGCGLAFVLGRTFPVEGEAVTRDALANALVTCHLAVQILGPRAPRPGPAGGSRASFGALLLGPSIPGWREIDLTTVDLRVSLDGNVVAQGERDRDPLGAALWLAEVLAAQDRVLEAGDVVGTGSRVGVLQVLPGQAFAARGGRVGGLALTFA
jgi:2-keto-4-pentenoate hydratase